MKKDKDMDRDDMKKGKSPVKKAKEMVGDKSYAPAKAAKMKMKKGGK